MDGLIQYIKNLLETNIIASGGLFVMVAGGIMASIFRIYRPIIEFLKRRFIVVMDVSNNDDTFKWFSNWLATTNYAKRTNLLSVISRRSRASDPKKPSLYFVPAPGNHLFFYKKRIIWIYRNREKMQGGSGSIPILFEQYTITMLGRNKNILKQMIADARDYNYKLEQDKVRIYINSDYDWINIECQIPRKLNTVILKDRLQYQVLDDIKEFFKKENWYNKMGIPYRRGYLLHGCPGTGKTSLVKALAGELGIPIYILNISKEMKEDKFQSLISDVPQKSIIVIEDIDCLFTKKGEMDKKYNITFKTILNAIDGLISPYGTLLFLTTNHKLKLDEALIRPGRIDKKYKIDKMDQEQAGELFKLFYPKFTHDTKRFSDQIENDKYTPAQLQQYFIDRPDVNLVLKEVNKIKES